MAICISSLDPRVIRAPRLRIHQDWSKHMKTRNFLPMAVLTLVASHCLQAETLPLESFFKNPQFTAFQVSPDGRELAALAPVNGRMNIVVMDLATRQPRAITGVSSQDVSGFMWANNDRLLFFMDKDGSESFGIFAVNKDGSSPRTLVEPLEAQIRGGRSRIRVVRVLDTLDSEPEWVLVSSNERRAAYPEVFRLNINTGRTKIVQRNPGNVTGWFTDWDGKVIGAAFQEKLETGFMMLSGDGTGEWETLTRSRFDEPSYSPAGIKGNGEEGWVTSHLTPDGKVRDKAALYEFNFKTQTLGKLVYEHPEIDCCGLIMNEKSRDMIGVAYMVGKPERVYLDERWSKIMSGIDQALPDTINGFASIDDGETVAVVVAFNSTQPPVYYLYDFEQNTLEWLAESRPWIEPTQMAAMQPYSFEARDGRTLHGYLTLPNGSAGKNLPLVVNPHGGPWARDGWGYNPEHQFLANRGYAVLQVNFRGSTGFGMDHMKSSWKQWGQAMQDDITDSVNWAVQQGIADPGRICIYGGSYGGYAAMAGLTFTPELYRCGINYVGVTDLPLLFSTAPDSWAAGEEQMKVMVGNPDTEEEFLEQWSPSSHADKIRAPVFMAYGLQDPRVNIKHAHVMEKAMDKAGVRYETMVKKDEGHGFRKEENRYDFYGRMETFLAENLSPGGQPANANP
jgi:dipeptidyl aminopeptidase/acylaminoacyl peptidase